MTVEAREDVKVVAFDSWARFRMKIYCSQRLPTTMQSHRGPAYPEKRNEIRARYFTQHKALSEALDLIFQSLLMHLRLHAEPNALQAIQATHHICEQHQTHPERLLQYLQLRLWGAIFVARSPADCPGPITVFDH